MKQTVVYESMQLGANFVVSTFHCKASVSFCFRVLWIDAGVQRTEGVTQAGSPNDMIIALRFEQNGRRSGLCV